eukprot:6466916-Amphidinium_carterae.2
MHFGIEDLHSRNLSLMAVCICVKGENGSLEVQSSRGAAQCGELQTFIVRCKLCVNCSHQLYSSTGRFSGADSRGLLIGYRGQRLCVCGPGLPMQ